MKYANIQMTRKGRCTIGDEIQLLAIDNLYREMGIDADDIIRIPYNELSTYSGEYVVLPISFPLYGFSHDAYITVYSERIIPVFIGASIMVDELCEEDIAYFRKYEPIGCRDQHTMNVMRKYGIVAYLNGCMTATLPRRGIDMDRKADKVYCVDMPDNLMKYVPCELKKDAIFMNHVFMSEECENGVRDKAMEVYGEYYKSAKLVITTRLHAALPCAAMGIPVVLMKCNKSFRFGILKNILPVYGEKDFDNINWNPRPAEFESLKKQMINLSIMRLQDAMKQYRSIYSLSEQFENINETNDEMNYFEAITDTIKMLQEKYQPNDAFQYGIWAVTQTAQILINYIRSHYKNAELVYIVDRDKRFQFMGKNVESIETIADYNESVQCYVCAPAAMPMAKKFFEDRGLSNYYLCWSDDLPR